MLWHVGQKTQKEKIVIGKKIEKTMISQQKKGKKEGRDFRLDL